MVYTERAETAAVSRCTTEKRTEREIAQRKGQRKGHCTEKGRLHRERDIESEIAQRKGQRKGDYTEKGRLHRERDRERVIVSSPLLVMLKVLDLVVKRKLRWNRSTLPKTSQCSNRQGKNGLTTTTKKKKK